MKLVENCYVGNKKTDAALTLLTGRWQGDRVVFLGDYAEFNNETDPFRRAFEKDLNGMHIEDYLFDKLTDITGIFAHVKSSPWCYYVDYETDEQIPYTGPFDTDIKHFRYVIDETQHEFVDRDLSPVRYIYDSGEIARYDPVPELLSSDNFNYPSKNRFTGRWFGHHIKPSNEKPDTSYRQIAQQRTYWDSQPIITASDEAIRAVIEHEKIDLKDRDTGALFLDIEQALLKQTQQDS